MPTNSEDIQRLKEIDLSVSEYEWTCPHCGKLNTEPNFGVKITTVQCECETNFRVSNYWQ